MATPAADAPDPALKKGATEIAGDLHHGHLQQAEQEIHKLYLDYRQDNGTDASFWASMKQYGLTADDKKYLSLGYAHEKWNSMAGGLNDGRDQANSWLNGDRVDKFDKSLTSNTPEAQFDHYMDGVLRGAIKSDPAFQPHWFSPYDPWISASGLDDRIKAAGVEEQQAHAGDAPPPPAAPPHAGDPPPPPAKPPAKPGAPVRPGDPPPAAPPHAGDPPPAKPALPNAEKKAIDGKLDVIDGLADTVGLQRGVPIYKTIVDQYIKRAQVTGEPVDAQHERAYFLQVMKNSGFQINDKLVAEFMRDGRPEHLPKEWNTHLTSHTQFKLFADGEKDQMRESIAANGAGYVSDHLKMTDDQKRQVQAMEAKLVQDGKATDEPSALAELVKQGVVTQAQAEAAVAEQKAMQAAILKEIQDYEARKAAPANPT